MKEKYVTNVTRKISLSRSQFAGSSSDVGAPSDGRRCYPGTQRRDAHCVRVAVEEQQEILQQEVSSVCEQKATIPVVIPTWPRSQLTTVVPGTKVTTMEVCEVVTLIFKLSVTLKRLGDIYLQFTTIQESISLNKKAKQCF